MYLVFYSSILENILDNGINFAKQYIDISDKNLRIIHCRKELLNKRSELISKCRHVNKYLLSNHKSNEIYTYIYIYIYIYIYKRNHTTHHLF